ncbi:MAG: cob(I)yrinic acid a,c-diamide adenosyltransferase [Thermoguttaceae bacterium]|jgi:cob(I)alamin adenosyltransferase
MTAKIYTRTGDQGETGLVWGPRVGKDMARIETIGAIDELNAVLGLARSENLPTEIDGPLERIQNELFCFGAEVATPRAAEHGMQQIQRRHVESLEADIDRISERLAPLSQFVVPCGSRAAAEVHLARTVCRRAERRLVALVRECPEDVSLLLLAYLNRLGDLLFVLARAANALADYSDTLWRK